MYFIFMNYEANSSRKCPGLDLSLVFEIGAGEGEGGGNYQI